MNRAAGAASSSQPAPQDAVATVVPSVVLPTLGVGDATAVEGEELVFTARLSAASETPVTVNYQTANGTATNGDYTSARGTLVFAAGETQKQITVHTTADQQQEGDEHLWLVLSKAQGATLADAWSTGAIRDNDREPTINVSNLLGPADGGRFVVSLSNPYEQTVSVDYVLSSARGNSTQHTSETAGTLTFAPGETLVGLPVAATTVGGAGGLVEAAVGFVGAAVALPLPTAAERGGSATAAPTGDSAPSGAHVTLSLSNASNATIARGEGGGTIVPAAAPPASSQPAPWDSAAGDSAGAMFLSGGSPTLTVEGGSCLEGGWLGFSVTISDAKPTEPVTVCFSTADGTARSEYDYSYTSGELIFYGAGTQYVSVATIDDEVYEGDETFSLVLYNEVLGTYWATGTLFDGESPPTISIDGDSATEGGESTLDFLVTISGPTEVNTSVQWATRDGSATHEAAAGLMADYVAGNDYVFFAHYPGQWDPYRWISVELCNDLHYDGGTEEFYVDLSNPIGATLAGNGTAAGTIYDNDPLPLLTLAPATCSEAAGQMTFTLYLSNGNQSPVEVSWETAELDGSYGIAPATAAADYTPTAGTAIFQPGETELTVTVPILDDSYCEPDEGFLLRVTGTTGCTPDPYLYPSGTATAVGTIEDDPEFLSDIDTVPPANPLFVNSDEYQFFIPPDAKSGAQVAAELPASIGTGKTKQYSIYSGNNDGLFAIDAATGKLTLAKDVPAGTITIPNLTVRVSDAADATLHDDATVTLRIAPVVGVTGDIHAIEGTADKISIQFARNDDGIFGRALTVRFRIDWAASSAEGLHPDDFLPADPEHPERGIFPTCVTPVAGKTNEYDVPIPAGQRFSESIVLRAKADEVYQEKLEWVWLTVLPDPKTRLTYAVLPENGSFSLVGLAGMMLDAIANDALRLYVLDGATRFGALNGTPDLADKDAQGQYLDPGIAVNDARQGYVNNCPFAATLIALVRDNPAWIESHLGESSDANGNKVFTVDLFRKAPGEETYSAVTYTFNLGTQEFLNFGVNMMPLMWDYHYDDDPADLHNGVEVWPQLYEMADCKLVPDRGTATTPKGAWLELTGKPADTVDATGKTGQQIFDALKAAMDAGKQVVMGTKGEGLIPAEILNKYNPDPGNPVLVDTHAYVLDSIQDGENKKVKFYNPWGYRHVEIELNDLDDVFNIYTVLDTTRGA